MSENTLNSNKFPKGSEWRKWDLHVHSPYTLMENDFNNCSDEDFINKILDNNIEVIGLTNYFKFRDEEFILKDKLKAKGVQTMLNLEIRLDYQNKDNECLDLHIIFAESVTKDQINLLLQNLDSNVKGINTKVCSLSSNDDFKYAVINFDHLIIQLNNKSFNLKEKYLIGFLSRGRGNGRTSSNYEKITQSANFLIHSSDNPQNIIEDRNFWLEYNKPLLQSSDCHKVDDVGSKFTWIKADPTFEGLKQIIYEPKERVSIQKENPEFEKPKPFFESVEILDTTEIYKNDNISFQKTKITLNKNLVTIIGGRGEGKSTLINYLGNALNHFKSTTQENCNFTSDKNFTFTYSKLNIPNIEKEDKLSFNSSDKESNNLQFVFIKQGDLKDKVSSKDKQNNLSKTIKDILKIENASFSQKLQEEIDSINNLINEISNWIENTDENGNKINTKEYQDNIIKQNTVLLSNLQNSQNKQNIKSYNVNLKEISKFRKYNNQADQIIGKINLLESQIKDINIDNIFKSPDLKGYHNEIVVKKSNHEKEIKLFEATNAGIKSNLLISGVSGDLTTLLENTSKYQSLIDQAESHVVLVEQKEKLLLDQKTKRAEQGSKIEIEYNRQRQDIDSKREHFLDGKTEEQKVLIKKILLNENKIKIDGKVSFDKVKFYELLWQSVHQGSYKQNELEANFGIKDLESWSNYVTNEFNLKYDEMNHKKKDFLALFFDLQTRSNYLSSEAEITYDGKEISKLSAGQKGTVYLRISLANDAFDTPIIFDQPEDDLDNKFIVSELVDIFKELKQYRQVIIVTHNANLVVNADSEQIIIAKNENNIISYHSGSLENSTIQEHVCDILEGGKVAFEQRKKKYNF